jgi:hypothetical protein
MPRHPLHQAEETPVNEAVRRYSTPADALLARTTQLIQRLVAEGRGIKERRPQEQREAVKASLVHVMQYLRDVATHPQEAMALLEMLATDLDELDGGRLPALLKPAKTKKETGSPPSHAGARLRATLTHAVDVMKVGPRGIGVTESIVAVSKAFVAVGFAVTEPTVSRWYYDLDSGRDKNAVAKTMRLRLGEELAKSDPSHKSWTEQQRHDWLQAYAAAAFARRQALGA